MTTHAGGHRWHALSNALRARHLPCGICGQPIDYSLKYPDPGAFTADHIRPWAGNPDLRFDPGNLQAAHNRCNYTKSDTTGGPPNLGYLSADY